MLSSLFLYLKLCRRATMVCADGIELKQSNDRNLGAALNSWWWWRHRAVVRVSSTWWRWRRWVARVVRWRWWRGGAVGRGLALSSDLLAPRSCPLGHGRSVAAICNHGILGWVLLVVGGPNVVLLELLGRILSLGLSLNSGWRLGSAVRLLSVVLIVSAVGAVAASAISTASAAIGATSAAISVAVAAIRSRVMTIAAVAVVATSLSASMSTAIWWAALLEVLVGFLDGVE